MSPMTYVALLRGINVGGKSLLKMAELSGFTKVVGTEVYRQMTIRNYSTCQKILQLMAPR